MTTLNVCIGSACHIKGSYNVISSFQQIIEEKNLGDEVELKAVFCMGHCTQAVSVTIGEDSDEVHSVSGATAKSFFVEKVLPLLNA